MTVALHPHENFWPKVDRRGDDECWPWTGKRNHKGYGDITRRSGGAFRCFKATHIAWEIANGQPWPEGKIALHSCDNPPCVNPAHIRPGTAAENAADAMIRGRTARKGRPPLPQIERVKASAPRPKRPEYCARCGHHRTDDLPNKLRGGMSWRCRECSRAAGRQRKAA